MSWPLQLSFYRLLKFFFGFKIHVRKYPILPSVKNFNFIIWLFLYWLKGNALVYSVSFSKSFFKTYNIEQLKKFVLIKRPDIVKCATVLKYLKYKFIFSALKCFYICCFRLNYCGNIWLSSELNRANTLSYSFDYRSCRILPSL